LLKSKSTLVEVYKRFPVQINHTIPIISINSRAIHPCVFKTPSARHPKYILREQRTLQVKLQRLWDYVLCVELSTFRSPFNVKRHLVTRNWYI